MVPIHEGAIRATELQRIKVSPNGHGLFSYDPAFVNAAASRSAISYMDGDRHFVPLEGRACAVQRGRGVEPGL